MYSMDAPCISRDREVLVLVEVEEVCWESSVDAGETIYAATDNSETLRTSCCAWVRACADGSHWRYRGELKTEVEVEVEVEVWGAFGDELILVL
jgi:acyl-CoA hydrolase